MGRLEWNVSWEDHWSCDTCSIWANVYLWVERFPANEGIGYIYNVVPHWLRNFPAIDLRGSWSYVLVWLSYKEDAFFHSLRLTQRLTICFIGCVNIANNVGTIQLMFIIMSSSRNSSNDQCQCINDFHMSSYLMINRWYPDNGTIWFMESMMTLRAGIIAICLSPWTKIISFRRGYFLNYFIDRNFVWLMLYVLSCLTEIVSGKSQWCSWPMTLYGVTMHDGIYYTTCL